MKTKLGEVDINVPRDRNGEFEPKILSKYQRNATGIEEKILSLYAAGMNTRDITDQIKALYGIEISAVMVSKISERILPEVMEWQNRPLDDVYPTGFREAINATFPDAHIQRCIIHQIRSSTRYVSCKDIKTFVKDMKTVYTATDVRNVVA